MARNILITGTPGIGKTTLIIRLFEALKNYRPVGFYTEEIRSGGRRLGFELIDHTGHRQILSHVDIQSHYRVGKYGVDIDTLDSYLESLTLENEQSRPVIIDEIGKMECFSDNFRRLVLDLLASKHTFIATIARRGSQFIESIKSRKDITLIEVTSENRDKLPEEIFSHLNIDK